MLSAPAKPTPVVGLAGMNVLQMLELAAKPAEMKQMLVDIAKAEEALAANRSAARVEQTHLMEAERQLSERKKAIDADWVRLKQAQSDLDDAKATHAKAVGQAAAAHAANVAALSDRSAELDKRERGLDMRAAEQNKGWGELEAKTQTASAELGGRERHLDAREIAVAEREKAADDLAALMAKVQRV